MRQTELTPYIKHAQSVQEMISPFQTIGISGVFYSRIYTDGTIINLANDAYWTGFYFDKLITGQYQDKDIVDQIFSYSGVSLWAFNPNNCIWQDAKQYFGYRNGMLICEDTARYREVMGFYSIKDDQTMNHFYVNQIDTLKKMQQYFIVQAQELIEQTEQERQASMHQVFSKRLNDEEQRHTRFSTEKSITVIHKDTGLPIKLSPQRGKCFINLLLGKSVKETAKIMQLSPKTIEHYLEILRKELSCRSSKDLILFYMHHRLHKIDAI